MLRVAGGARARPLPYLLFLFLAASAAANLAPISDTLLYEAFNLADGRRSVLQIRDILAGRYGCAPLPAIAAYFERLARAGAVTLSP